MGKRIIVLYFNYFFNHSYSRATKEQGEVYTQGYLANTELQCDFSKRYSRFFCKRTNNIHEFEGCFQRGEVSSNGFFFNGCILKTLNFIGSLAKKLENLLFSKHIVIGYCSSKYPGSNSRIAIRHVS